MFGDKKANLNIFFLVQILLLIFVVILCLWAVIKEEVVTPINDKLIDYAEADEYGSMYVENMKNNELIELESTIDTIFLLCLIYMIQFTLVEAFISPAKSLISFMFETVGGLVVVLWLFSAIVVKFIDFFFNNYLFQIFGNVIENTTIINYFWTWGIFLCFIWYLILSYVNQVVSPTIKKRLQQ